MGTVGTVGWAAWFTVGCAGQRSCCFICCSICPARKLLDASRPHQWPQPVLGCPQQREAAFGGQRRHTQDPKPSHPPMVSPRPRLGSSPWGDTGSYGTVTIRVLERSCSPGPQLCPPSRSPGPPFPQPWSPFPVVSRLFVDAGEAPAPPRRLQIPALLQPLHSAGPARNLEGQSSAPTSINPPNIPALTPPGESWSTPESYRVGPPD